MTKESGQILMIGCTFALVAVLLGAFGAHGLETRISADRIETYETAVRYQFYHSLAILMIGLISIQMPKLNVGRILWFFSLGILLFSGSLYILATRELTGWSGGFVGPLTPIGGALFIAGWMTLILRIRTLLKSLT